MKAAAARPRGRQAGAARYRQIAARIEADIANGRYPVGSLLPTEIAFGQRFDSGRHTVREALRLLAQAGLIARRAGSGSTVLARARVTRYVHAISNFEEWFNYPAGVQRQRLAQGAVAANAAMAESLGCAVGSRWFCISALRLLAGAAAPLCWVDIYLPQRFAAVAASRDIDKRPVHEQIEAMFGVAIAQVEVRIAAAGVPPRMAPALAVAPDSPALLLQRRYLAASGDVLQATRTVHPENRYVYALKFKRSGGSQDG